MGAMTQTAGSEASGRLCSTHHQNYLKITIV